MKKGLKSILSIVLILSTLFCATIPALAEEGELYLCELRLIYAEDYEEALAILEDSEFSDYKLLKDNLNEDSGEIGVWLAYKTTDDIEDAITDIAVMQMNGGYTEGNFQAMIDQSYEEYVEMGEIYLAAIDYFVEAYDAGHFLAESAYRQLNFYTGLDDHEDEKLGDVFYDGIDEHELATMFLEGNSYVLKNIRSLISMGVAYNEDGKTYLNRVGDAAKEMIADSHVYDNEDYDDLAFLISPTITVFRSMFKELSAYEAELNYDDETITSTEIKYIEYAAIAEMMRRVSYLDGKTLYQFCLDYTVNEDDYSSLYPLVAALNDGQIAMTQVAHYYDVVRYSMEIYPKETIEKKLNEHEEKYGDYPFNIYTGVDRSLYDGSFALTSALSRSDAYTESGMVEAFFGDGNAAGSSFQITTGIMGVALFRAAFLSAATDGGGSAGGAVGGTVTEQAASTVSNTVVQSVEEQIAAAINSVAHKTISVATSEGIFMEDALNLLFLKYGNANNAMLETWAGMTFADKYQYFESTIANGSTTFSMNDNISYALMKGEIVSAKSGIVESAQPAAEEATKKTVENTAGASSGGISAFTGILFLVGGALMLYSAISLGMTLYNYYHPEYDDVPIAMVDLIDTVDGDRYIRYDVVFTAETNKDGVYEAADLNAFEGERWNALYYTKSYEAGKPLLADEFVVSNNNNKPQENYAPVHRFGEVVCYDLNKYNFDGDTYIYLSVKQSEEQKEAVAEVPTVVGSMMGSSVWILAGGIGAIVGIGGTLATQEMLKKKKTASNAKAK